MPSNEEITQALITTSLYSFYTSYVEPLEEEHDLLLERVEELEKLLEVEKNKPKETKVVEKKLYKETESETATRYRNMCIDLKRKNEQLKRVIERNQNVRR